VGDCLEGPHTTDSSVVVCSPCIMYMCQKLVVENAERGRVESCSYF
jgi:hypothetical protein